MPTDVTDQNVADNPTTTNAPQNVSPGSLAYQPQTPSTMESFPTSPVEKSVPVEVETTPEIPAVVPETTPMESPTPPTTVPVSTIANQQDVPNVVDLRGNDEAEQRVADDATKLTKDADEKEEEFIDGVNAAHGNS